MSSQLDQLYGEVIMDHQRDPRNYGCPAQCTLREEGFNPVCGDKVTLALKPRSDGKGLEEVYFEGQGCSISMASASMLTEEVAGKSYEETLQLIADFRDLMKGEPNDAIEGDLQALVGVQRFPVRIKCALLPFMTLKKAVENISRGQSSASAPATTEDSNHG